MRMKLRYARNSPFVRKVMVTAIEAGLDDRIERVPTDITDPASDLPNQNPLGKVPALVLEDGRVLVESSLICAYLDTLHDRPKLLPSEGDARLDVLQLQALSDGLCDAAINVARERGRPEGMRWPMAEDRQRQKFERTLDRIEQVADDLLVPPVTLGQIALGCALGWIDLRLGDFGWRAARPKIAAWYGEFAARPSMVATAPATVPG
jgi:glutathione S-transferase